MGPGSLLGCPWHLLGDPHCRGSGWLRMAAGVVLLPLLLSQPQTPLSCSLMSAVTRAAAQEPH